MSRVSKICIAVGLLLTMPTPPLPAHAQVLPAAALAGGTIGGFIDGLKSLVKELEDSAHSLIDHGNTALGQQQMVLAGIISKVIEQLSTAYGNALGKTFEEISGAERDTFSSVTQSIGDINKLREMTATDIQNAIYKTQGAANQLIDRLPLTERYPLFYGLTVRDLTTDPGPNPSDIEILGFHFVDPHLGSKAPKITVAGTEMPEGAVSVLEDRVKIQIPEIVKKKIGFGNTPCNPRPTFPIEILVKYGDRRGFWPISWTSEKEAKFHGNALAGADLFTVSVTYGAIRTTTPIVPHTFSARSGWAGMGCEQTTSASVRFDLPPGAQEISCTAAWVDTSNVGGSSQNCTVGGTVATGSGSMRGRNKDCIKIPPFGPNVCNCPGGGHGYLQISGSYKVPEPKTEAIADIPLSPLTLIGQSDISTSFPRDASLNITKVSTQVRRKSCPDLRDQIEINVLDWKNRVDVSSKEGLFKATLWNGQLTVGRK